VGNVSMIFGVLMILEGLVLYAMAVYRHLHQGADGPSPTALIPAGFGLVLLVLGVIARLGGERARKHTMHFAAMVGLIGVIASIVMLARRLSAGVEWNLAMTGMALLGLLNGVFLAMCVNSFIQVRRARKAHEQGGALPPG
jgi:uncharacterized membrane protein